MIILNIIILFFFKAHTPMNSHLNACPASVFDVAYSLVV